MYPLVGVIVALVLLRAHGRNPNHGNCLDDYCVTVHTSLVNYNSAQKACEDKGGHLLTVRTRAAHSAVLDLLSRYTGNFWIGLRYMAEICSESSQDLKGYTWVTGDEATGFTNWKTHDRVCSYKCVSLSKADPKWTERQCNHAIDGYLCEYSNSNTCPRLALDSAVLYETPFGFAREDLQEVPNASNATEQHLGTKYICSDGSWHKAPWSCEVYRGGCEHDCYAWNDTFICTCPSGYTLENNAIRCSKTHTDPCLRANCSHECVSTGDNYVCQCHYGYELEENGVTCKNMGNNCDEKNLCPEENSYCVNTAGGFMCQCKNGFRKEMDTCEDDDECFSGPCEHSCINTIGSYYCECAEGFRASSKDRHKCILYCPQWECPVVACDLNNPFQCECPRGFILEERPGGNVCIDIDECENPNCDQNCTNTPGSYICSCNEGFLLTGDARCVKIVEMSPTESSTLTTTQRSPTNKTVSTISAGGLLGIIVCTVMVILLMVCVVHHNMKRCGKISTAKNYSKSLQQVTTEKYVKKHSIPNVNYKTSSF